MKSNVPHLGQNGLGLEEAL